MSLEALEMYFFVWIRNPTDKEKELLKQHAQNENALGYGYHRNAGISFFVGVSEPIEEHTDFFIGEQMFIRKTKNVVELLEILSAAQDKFGITDESRIDITLIKHNNLKRRVSIESFADTVWLFLQECDRLNRREIKIDGSFFTLLRKL